MCVWTWSVAALSQARLLPTMRRRCQSGSASRGLRASSLTVKKPHHYAPTLRDPRTANLRFGAGVAPVDMVGNWNYYVCFRKSDVTDDKAARNFYVSVCADECVGGGEHRRCPRVCCFRSCPSLAATAIKTPMRQDTHSRLRNQVYGKDRRSLVIRSARLVVGSDCFPTGKLRCVPEHSRRFGMCWARTRVRAAKGAEE